MAAASGNLRSAKRVHQDAIGHILASGALARGESAVLGWISHLSKNVHQRNGDASELSPGGRAVRAPSDHPARHAVILVWAGKNGTHLCARKKDRRTPLQDSGKLQSSRLANDWILPVPCRARISRS